MALNIKHPEADRLARELAERTGETITAVVIGALRERPAREERRTSASTLAEEIKLIAKRCAALPVLNHGTPEEILDYDEHGLRR